MATERIERLLNPSAITDFQQLRAEVDQNVQSFEKLIAAGVELNTNIGKAGNFKALNAEITKLKENEIQLKGTIAELQLAMDALNKKQSEGTNTSSALEKAQKKLNDSYSAEARQLAVVKEQQTLVNKANKQSAQETLGLVDAYKQLEQEYNKAERAARNLTIQYGANSKEAKEAIQLAQQLDARLKEADYSVGKFGRNVGNYGSALKTLESYLADVRTELGKTQQAAAGGLSLSVSTPTGPASSASRSGGAPLRGAGTDQATASMVKYGKATNDTSDRVAELSKQEELLTRIVNSQVAGYASATAELKANEKALQSLQAAGLQNTEFYKVLLKDTAELKDRVGDLKEEIKALSSDSRSFDLVAGAVTGLVNVFQVAASTAELVAGNNDDVQKSIQRLLALQNISQGVQELANELTTKGTALNKVYNFVIGEGTVIKEANTVATIENTEATVVGAAATEGMAVATEGLSVAMKVLRGALAASGIGLLIVGIVYLIGKIQEWQQADLNLMKQQAELNNVLLETLRLNKEIADLTRSDIGTEIQALKNKTAENQAYGRSQGEVLAAELELAKARQLNSSIKFFDTHGFQQLGDLETQLRQAATALEDFNEKQANTPIDMRGNQEQIDAQRALLQSQLDLTKEKYAEQRVIVDDYVNNNLEVINKQTQIERLNLDERRKFALESATLQANGQIEANNRALADERTTLEQRLALVKSNAEQQAKIAEANRQNIRTDPGASKNDQAIAAKNLKAQLKKITLDSEVEQFKIKEEYRKRDQAAVESAFESGIALVTKYNDDIKQDENKSFDERVAAAKDSLDAQERLIEAQKKIELDAAGLTAEERKSIETQANNKILEGRLQFTKDLNDITLSALEKSGDNRLHENERQNADEITKLNEMYQAGLLSTKQYQAERLKLEQGNAITTFQITTENLQKRIDYEKSLGHDTVEFEAELAKKQQEISDDLTNAKIDNLQKLHDKQQEVGQALTDLFQALDEASIEREKDQLDRQSAAVDERKQRETDFVNQQVLTQQQKADALAVIDQKAQRDKEVIAQRQQKLDEQKARTDKVIAAAKIVADTAQAVFRLSADAAAAKAQAALLLSNPVTAAYAPIAAASAVSIAAQIPLVIGLGAANLAKVLGTKAFRYGGTTEKDGLILVGDGFQTEYMVNKAGEITATPSVPTLMMAEADTRIYPNRKSLEASLSDGVYGGSFVADSGQQYKYMAHTIGRKLDVLTKTVKEKKETHMHFKKGGWDMMKNEGGQLSEYYSKSLR